MPKQTFVCDFGDGLKCTTVVNHTRLFQGKHPMVAMEWSKRLTAESLDRILPQYREWLHSINRAAVEKTGKAILYALQVKGEKGVTFGGRWECWAYQPGKPPELAKIIDSDTP